MAELSRAQHSPPIYMSLTVPSTFPIHKKVKCHQQSKAEHQSNYQTNSNRNVSLLLGLCDGGIKPKYLWALGYLSNHPQPPLHSVRAYRLFKFMNNSISKQITEVTFKSSCRSLQGKIHSILFYS